MKNRIITLFLLASSLLFTAKDTSAQQDPQYSHYMFNGFVFNPSLAGNKPSLSMVGLFRAQYVGFDGGPQTQTISAHMPAPSLKGGIGLHIINDQIGFERNLHFAASYAYKYELPTGNISAGASLGFIQRTLDGAKLKALTPGDPLIPAGSVNAVKPDINLGLTYNTDAYYVGFSTTHLTRPNMSFDVPGTSEYNSVVHYYLTGGYNFVLSPSIEIKPSVMIKMARTSSFDINALAFYNQKYWGGLSYRLNDAIVAIAGMNLTDRIKMSYSYDYTISNLSLTSNGSAGSHEIILGYDVVLVKKIKTDVIIKTPRFL